MNSEPLPTTVCGQIAPWLPLLAQHLLEPPEAAEVQVHLAQCRHCRATLEEEVQLDQVLRRTMQQVRPIVMSQQAITRLLATAPTPVRAGTALRRLRTMPVAAMMLSIVFLTIFAVTILPKIGVVLLPTSPNGPIKQSSVFTIPATQQAEAWAQLAARPLHLPQVAPGGVCPRSKVFQNTQPAIQGLGAGPGYVAFKDPTAGSGNVTIAPPGPNLGTGSAWGHIGATWWLAPSYAGIALVRGQRADGTGMMRFAASGIYPANVLDQSLQLVADQATAGWSQLPSMLFFQQPGCYALQIDGTDFSEVIVIQINQGR